MMRGGYEPKGDAPSIKGREISRKQRETQEPTLQTQGWGTRRRSFRRKDGVGSTRRESLGGCRGWSRRIGEGNEVAIHQNASYHLIL